MCFGGGRVAQCTKSFHCSRRSSDRDSLGVERVSIAECSEQARDQHWSWRRADAVKMLLSMAGLQLHARHAPILQHLQLPLPLPQQMLHALQHPFVTAVEETTAIVLLVQLP